MSYKTQSSQKSLMHIHRCGLDRAIKIHDFYSHKSVSHLASSEKPPHAANGNKYRDPQPDILQRVRELVISPKWYVFIKSLPSELRDPKEKEEKKGV